MIENKKYQVGDIELAMFPTSILNIHQGMNEARSHKKSFSLDLVGKSREVIYAYAPFDCTIKWLSEDNSRVLFESDNEVLLANEEKDFVQFILSNADEIKEYSIGQKFKQGEKIYQSGNYKVTVVVHIDLKVARGKFEGQDPIEPSFLKPAKCMYPERNHYKIKNQIEPYNIFWINDTEIIESSKYPWKTYPL